MICLYRVRDPEIHRSAVFSADRVYRYRLHRQWGENGIHVAFCLCNPSTADENSEDATSRRGVGFAQLYGAKEMTFVNANPFRATDPKSQEFAPESVMAENDRHLELVAIEADLIIGAWGDGVLPGLGQRALGVFNRMNRQVWCLSRTRKGNPGHPLYLPASSAMKLYASPTRGAKLSLCEMNASRSS